MKYLKFFTATLLLLGMVVRAHAGAYDDMIKAVNIGDTKEVASLLQRGMDANTVEANGQTLLHTACWEGHLEIVKLLVQAGADINKRNRVQETPIMLATYKGRLPLVEFLIAKEAELNHPGWTPLLYAAAEGHAVIIKLLTENSVYIDQTAPNGLTALMMAVIGGHIDSVHVLMEEGADGSIVSNAKHTAMSLAAERKHEHIVAALRQRGVTK